MSLSVARRPSLFESTTGAEARSQIFNDVGTGDLQFGTSDLFVQLAQPEDYGRSPLNVWISGGQLTGRTSIDWALLLGAIQDTQPVVSTIAFDYWASGALTTFVSFVRFTSQSERTKYTLTKFPSFRRRLTTFQSLLWDLAVESVPKSGADLPEQLSEVASELRTRLDLPVQDIAHMSGLGRRQFYNLLAGNATSREVEEQIRLLHSYIDRLWKSVGRDAKAVRSVVLSPLPELDHRSFYDAAVSLDRGQLDVAYRLLAGLVSTGEGRLRVPRLPPSVVAHDRDLLDRTVEELRRYRELDDRDAG